MSARKAVQAGLHLNAQASPAPAPALATPPPQAVLPAAAPLGLHAALWGGRHQCGPTCNRRTWL